MTELISAFIIGLVSAGHCFGMCGGLVVAAGFNSQKPSYIWFYNLGRIATYVLLGGFFGLTISSLPGNTLPWLKGLSIALLVFTALYFMGVTAAITKLEHVGVPIWRKIQPLTRQIIPVRSSLSALKLGLLWGFIPCGLVYTAIAFAISLGNAAMSVLAMLAFGLGTLPAMLFSGLAASRIQPLLNKRLIRVALGSVLLITALLLTTTLIQH